MKEIGNEKQCPYCGFQVDSLQISPYLPIRTVVGNRYIVGKLTEYNGEGAAYIAWDIKEKKTVSVREFFPEAVADRLPDGVLVSVRPGSEISFRDFYLSFMDLWGKLVRLNGLSALIRAIEVFEDCGTAYAVYEHSESVTLREFLLDSKTGYITWDKARQLFMPVLSTLGTLHTNGIIHRGISPLTLLIGKDGKARICGFCIPQARTARGDLDAQLFPGYAAVEQYGFRGQQGPWTDIYAFGAVLYRSLIGSDPIEATTRVANDRLMVPGRFAEQLPAYVINGLVNALQILPEDRTRTVEQLRAEITASPSAAVAEETYAEARRSAERAAAAYVHTGTLEIPRTEQNRTAPQKPQKKKSGASSALKAALICVLIGLVAFAGVSYFVLPDEYNVFNWIFGEREPTTAAPESKKYIVPNLVNKNYNDITQSEYYQIRFKFTPEYVFSDDVELGYITWQSIPPETEVAGGTEIKVKVSKGLEKITLPDLIGKLYDEVYEELTLLGFVVVKNVKSNDGTHRGGEIAAMSKTPEMQYNKGERIVLQVYEELETETANAQ